MKFTEVCYYPATIVKNDYLFHIILFVTAEFDVEVVVIIEFIIMALNTIILFVLKLFVEIHILHSFSKSHLCLINIMLIYYLFKDKDLMVLIS